MSLQVINSVIENSDLSVMYRVHKQNEKPTCFKQNILFPPTGLTVALQREDGGGSWMFRMIIGHGTDDNNGSYRVRVTKTGHAITRTKRHINP